MYSLSTVGSATLIATNKEPEMKNQRSDINDHLFAQIERLANEDLTAEQIEPEAKRGKAIVMVSSGLRGPGQGQRRPRDRQRQDRGQGRGQDAQGQGSADRRQGTQRGEEEDALAL